MQVQHVSVKIRSGESYGFYVIQNNRKPLAFIKIASLPLENMSMQVSELNIYIIIKLLPRPCSRLTSLTQNMHPHSMFF